MDQVNPHDSRLSDYVAYKSARRTGQCLRFLDIEQTNAPQHPMFTEDKKTRLPMKMYRKDQQTRRNSESEKKRKA